MKAAEIIVGYSRTALGQKEKKNNGGFVSPWLEKKMIERGFKVGDPWCMLFAELILFETYIETIHEKAINKLCSKSAVESWHNFSQDGTFPCNNIPAPGAVVIFQYYENGVKSWRGHAGIVVDVIGSGFFMCIEGNGNSQGGREGIEVVIRKRDTHHKPDNGLRILGFIHPANIDI